MAARLCEIQATANAAAAIQVDRLLMPILDAWVAVIPNLTAKFLQFSLCLASKIGLDKLGNPRHMILKTSYQAGAFKALNPLAHVVLSRAFKPALVILRDQVKLALLSQTPR